MKLFAVAFCMTLVGVVPAAGQSAAPATAADNYKTHCAVCHTPTGDSPIQMMNFIDGEWRHGSQVKDIVKVITEGVPSSAMMPFKEKLSEAEILALAKYVRAFDKHLK